MCHEVVIRHMNCCLQSVLNIVCNNCYSNLQYFKFCTTFCIVIDQDYSEALMIVGDHGGSKIGPYSEKSALNAIITPTFNCKSKNLV